MAKPSETTSNYSFTLKCLGALTFAVLAAGVVAAALYTKGTAVAGPVLASKTAMLGSAAVASTPFPALAVILFIGAICILPFFYRPGGYGAYARHHGHTGGFYPPTSSSYVVPNNGHGHSTYNPREHGHGGSSFFPVPTARTEQHGRRDASASAVTQHPSAFPTVHVR